MGAQMKPWTEAMVHHIADGRWYQIEEVVRVGMRAVPPGRALQEREANRSRLVRTGTGHQRLTTADQRIAAGARLLARRALHHQINRSHLQRDGDLVRTTR